MTTTLNISMSTGQILKQKSVPDAYVAIQDPK